MLVSDVQQTLSLYVCMYITHTLLLSCFSRVQLCATPWTAAYQAPPSMGFSRQEYWSGVPLAPLSGIKPASPALEDEVLTTGPQRSLKATKF